MSKKDLDNGELFFKGARIPINSYWIQNHPGGSKVLRVFDGRDATDQMLAMHSDEAIRKIEAMAGGEKTKALRDAHPKSDFQKLQDIAIEQNLFEASTWREAWKNLYSFGFAFFGIYLLIQGESPWKGAFSLAFGWYQLGWTGHDWGHHTYLPESTTAATWVCDFGCWMSGMLRGNTMLWWKLRHNTHHVVTNEVGADPDIKLAPLFNFFEDFLPSAFTQWQGFYYVPTLILLHAYWYVESWQVNLRQLGSRNRYNRMWAQADLLALVMHTAFFGWLALRQPLPMIFAYALSGLGTALIVFATHYGEERLDWNPEMDLLEQTIKTSRNIGGFLPFELDKEFWFHFSGGLNTQIEHHMFPRMPRHNLRKMTPYVKKLLLDRDFKWKESNLWECTRKCCAQLAANVARNLKMKEV